MTHPVVVGGTAAGVLDILAAFALSAYAGGTPLRVLQGIASGVLGPAAFTGSAPTALLGLALHFLIAFVAAAVYYAGSRVLPVLVRRAVVCGLAYGAAVYAFMNLLVLPLSRGSFRTPRWPFIVALIAIHMVCVGLPIAVAVRRGSLR